MSEPKSYTSVWDAIADSPAEAANHWGVTPARI